MGARKLSCFTFQNICIMAEKKVQETPVKEPIKFTNAEVADKYITNAKNDFQIRLPNLEPQWHGMFSNITLEVAESLIEQGYNRIAKKG